MKQKINFLILTIIYNFGRYRYIMITLRHTLTAISIGLLSLACNDVCHAQTYDRSNLTKLDHKFTIGFERQVYNMYLPKKVTMSDKTTKAEERCNRIVFRMKLTNRFRLETGLSYRDINNILKNNNKYARGLDITKPCRLSVPLTIQYQLQNERRRLRPYFGAGVQYFRNSNTSQSKEGTYMYNQGLSNSLKYINIIFTQGLIYDVTTDLQLTQSLHVLPESNRTNIGINFGIGYRIK